MEPYFEIHERVESAWEKYSLLQHIEFLELTKSQASTDKAVPNQGAILYTICALKSLWKVKNLLIPYIILLLHLLHWSKNVFSSNRM